MLQERAMIVRLAISQWTARKFDLKVTRKVAEGYGVAQKVGNYRKALVAEDALKGVAKVAREARTFHDVNTLPWDDFGGRLLPCDNFSNYTEKMRVLKGQFEAEVRAFCASYPDYVFRAERELRGMFNPADYPKNSYIRSRFAFSVDIDPVPNKADFRVSVGKDDLGKLQSEIESRTQEKVRVAMTDLWDRLAGVVGNFADRLADPEAIFRDSLVENVLELVELLPRLNVSKDAELEGLRKEVKRKLGLYHPQTLRENKAVRDKAAREAKAILERMSAYTGK